MEATDQAQAASRADNAAIHSPEDTYMGSGNISLKAGKTRDEVQDTSIDNAYQGDYDS